MHNSVNRWLTGVLLTLFVTIIAFGAHGASKARPSNGSTQNVLVVNTTQQPLPTSATIQGTPNVNVSSLPAVQVSNFPATQTVVVSSLPQVQIAPGNILSVEAVKAIITAEDTSPWDHRKGYSIPDQSTSVSSGAIYYVPDGKRLIIDSIDVASECDTVGDCASLLTLAVDGGDPKLVHIALKTPDGMSGFAIAHEAVHITAEAGDSISLQLARGSDHTTGVTTDEVTMTGHVISAS